MRSEWLGPLIVPLAALACLLPGKRRVTAMLAGYSVLAVGAWWLFVLRADRHWIACLPLAALLSGAGACWSRELFWRVSLLVLLVLTSISNFVFASGVPCGYNRYFVNLKSLRYDPDRLDPWQRYWNTHVKQGRVLLVGEAQVFDLEVPIVYNTWIDDSQFEKIVRGKSTADARRLLRELGISYIYVHWGEIDRYRRTKYGRWDFVYPETLKRLVAAGVLEPLPDIPPHPGMGYRVIAHDSE